MFLIRRAAKTGGGGGGGVKPHPLRNFFLLKFLKNCSITYKNFRKDHRNP